MGRCGAVGNQSDLDPSVSRIPRVRGDPRLRRGAPFSGQASVGAERRGQEAPDVVGTRLRKHLIRWEPQRSDGHAIGMTADQDTSWQPCEGGCDTRQLIGDGGPKLGLTGRKQRSAAHYDRLAERPVDHLDMPGLDFVG